MPCMCVVCRLIHLVYFGVKMQKGKETNTLFIHIHENANTQCKT